MRSSVAEKQCTWGLKLSLQKKFKLRGLDWLQVILYYLPGFGTADLSHTHPHHHIPVRGGWSHKGFSRLRLSLVHGLSDRDRGCVIASRYGGNGRDMDMDGDSPYERQKKEFYCGLLIYKVLSPKGYLYGRDVDKVGPGFWVPGQRGSRNLVWVWWMHFIKKAGLGLGPGTKLIRVGNGQG